MRSKTKSILDKYVARILSGESIHRYDLEAEFEKISKRYKDQQVVELLLKKAAESNSKYRQLFNELYGDMNKHGGGEFSL